MAVHREEDALAPALVRLRSPSGAVVGAGFLVTADIVCTCAHVVADALELPRTPEEAPGDPVTVEFSLLRDDDTGAVPAAPAGVVSWQRIDEDERGDVALLRLERPVPGTRPVPLVDGTQVWGHGFRVLGHPQGAEHGVWAAGTLRAQQGTGWLQMETDAAGPPVAPGFSGAPVWDEEQGGVVGMTVAVRRGAGSRTAYLIPSAALVDEGVIRPRCPFRGLAPFTEDDAEFFHGRADDTRRLREAVGRQAVTLVVGPSGCGKSSLVRAGLLPGTRADGMTVSELRPVPGTRPAAILARALVPLLEPESGEVARLRAAEDLAALLAPDARPDAGPAAGAGSEAGSIPEVTADVAADVTAGAPAGPSAGATAGPGTGAHGPAGPAPDLLAELRHRVLDRAGPGGHLLFLDQLEEYAADAPAAARELLELLIALTGDESGPAPAVRAGAAAPAAPNAPAPAPAPAPDPGPGPGRRPLRVVATARPETLDVLVTSRTAELLSGAVQFVSPLAARDLHRAVTAPVDAVPGLWFEPGLPERVVADAAGEPGRMPLVEFALTRLWERRSRSMLTHAAYDELGGVAGALAGYAEEAIAPLLRAEDGERHARRLFAQLTRPGEHGGHTRRPAPTASLDPALRTLARRLAATRLVVVGRTAGGEEIADLAHEALTVLWPRLRAWLDASRDFRLWQEGLRRDLRRWRDHDRETDALPGGRALATALHWLERRPEDVTPAEREYILLGRDRQRRGVRRLRAAVALLTALVLLTAGLSVTAWRSKVRADERLRTQASTVLAGIAERYAPNRPEVSVQMALAAWHTRRTPEAYAALLRQYARAERLTGSHPELWRGTYAGMRVTPDGSAAVVSTSGSGGGLTLLRGLRDGGRPRAARLRDVPAPERREALSPDGRRYAVATPDGRVRVWDLRGSPEEAAGRRPRVLESDDADGRKVNGVRLDFSGDGRRLLRALTFYDGTGAPSRHERTASLSAWDTGTGKPLTTAETLLPEKEFGDIAFADRPGRTVVVTSVGGAALRDLRTGRRLRGLRAAGPPAPGIAAGGDLVLTERARTGGEPDSRAVRMASGQEVRLPGGNAYRDLTDEYAIATSGLEEGHYAEVWLTRLRTGEMYRTRLPSGGPGGKDISERIAAVPGKDGGLTLLVPAGGALLTARAEPVAGARPTDGFIDVRGALSPDGRLIAVLADERLEILTAGGDRLASAKVPGQASFGGPPVWTADSRRVVLERGSGSPSVHAVRDPGRPVRLPVPGGGDGGEQLAAAQVVVPLDGSRVAVLTGDGRLFRADAATGRMLGEPVVAERMSAARRTSVFRPSGQLSPVPGRPDEVAVVTRAGNGDDTVRLWNLRTGERLGTLRVDRLADPSGFGNRGSFLFAPGGEELLAAHEDGSLRRWNVATGKRLGRPVAVGEGERPIGHGPGGLLVTLVNGADLRLRDLKDGGALVAEIPLASPLDTRLTGHRVISAGDFWYRELDLRGDGPAERLCAAVGRDFTAAERELLPSGASHALPADCRRERDG